MIPVKPQPEPDDFDEQVRKPAKQWLEDNQFPSRGPIPKDAHGKPRELKAFWTKCLDHLHDRYGGVCAYASIFIARTTGARSVDHYIAKSSAIEHAYEWRNYRLACAKMNSRKGTFDELLDPFEIKENTYVLDLLSGRMKPSPELSNDEKSTAQTTIDRLGLNDEEDIVRDRREFITKCMSGDISPTYLHEKCPFVYHEMQRQNALPVSQTHAPTSP